MTLVSICRRTLAHKWFLWSGITVVLCYPHLLWSDSASIPTGPAAAFSTKLQAGREELKAGHTGRALEEFLRAEALAQTPEQHAHALLSVSGSQILLFRYKNALQSADAALGFATEAHDDTLAGAAFNNRATVYTQLGDHQLALEAVKQAVRLLQHSDRRDYLARALLNNGDTQAELGMSGEAARSFQSSIQISREANIPAEEALAEDHLGLALVESKDFPGAQAAYSAALRLRVSARDAGGVATTKQHMAELAREKGDYKGALKLLNEAESTGGQTLSSIPLYWRQQFRGKTLLALGRRSEALTSFRSAARSADRWRQHALPGDVTSIRTSAALHSVYRDFVDLAAATSIEQHDALLAREALAVLAGSRAASLHEQMIASLGRQMQLQPRYFELLSNLQASEAALDLAGNAKQTKALSESIDRTRNELADLENKVGISQLNPAEKSEKTLSRISLTDIQHSLTSDELLLSFSLGDKKSFLWAVSRDRLALYQLPAEKVISQHADAYFAAVQKGVASREAGTLSNDLFAQLTPSFSSRKQWLVVGDGVLLDRVPFSSLPQPGASDPAGTLISAHSVRLLPSEQRLAPASASAHPPGRFLGIADPIYNLADARISHNVRFVHVSGSRQGVTLARLAGSASEVRSAAKVSGLSDIELLTGANASLSKLQQALSNAPSVVHFAVHVITASPGESGKSADSALALALTPNGVPELLTKEAIAQLRVPGALVVLSGCASQAGQVVPSAGLIGLGRSWLLAGAAAVIVSAWPTPDDSGGFWTDFYSRLHAEDAGTATLAQRASAALQETQLDMQRSAGYRSSPSFWAAYSIISED